jgi:hypothetical protein
MQRWLLVSLALNCVAMCCFARSLWLLAAALLLPRAAVLCPVGCCQTGWLRIYFSENAYATVPATMSTTAAALCATLHRKRMLPDTPDKHALFVAADSGQHLTEHSGAAVTRGTRKGKHAVECSLRSSLVPCC